MSHPLTPERLVYDLTPAGDPQISPDGSRIIFTLSTTDRESKKTTSHLWLCGVDGTEPQRLTWSGERNRGARWSPDGRHLAFVSDRVKKNGLFVLPVDGGGEAREVTRHGQDIGDLAWSPDGRRIAYVTQVDPENPDEAESPPDAALRSGQVYGQVPGMTTGTPKAMIPCGPQLAPAGGRIDAMGIPDRVVYPLLVRFLQALL